MFFLLITIARKVWSLVLADTYDTFDRRCEKSSARIVCCTPALYVWLVSHMFHHESRPICPLQGHYMCVEKGKANWEEILANMVGASVNWFPRWKEGGAGVLCSCEGFPNIPLMRTRGCINYNPVLAIRQVGYPMRECCRKSLGIMLRVNLNHTLCSPPRVRHVVVCLNPMPRGPLNSAHCNLYNCPWGDCL